MNPKRLAALVAEAGLDEGWYAKFAGELSPGGWPINSSSGKYENKRIVKSGAGTIYGLSGSNSLASGQWVHMFDTQEASLTGLVPVWIMPVDASAPFWADWGPVGRAFLRGCVLANSTTGPTYTAGAADCWYDAQYD